MKVGSYEWGIATRGILSDADRAELMEQLTAVAAVLAEPPEIGPVLLDEVPEPASALARDAEELCRDVSAEWLFHHCARTYLFAGAWASAAAVRFDPEVLYVAAMLHDLYVTERYEPVMEDECFAVAGAKEAETFSAARGAGARARTIADAISRHLNVSVPVEDGPEAHLLSVGVTMDVSGLLVDLLPTGIVAGIVARHPRAGSADGIAGVIRRQATNHPGTRSEFLRDVVGLDQLAGANGLDA